MPSYDTATVLLSKPDAVVFLKAITRPVGAVIELRALGDGEVVGRAFCHTPRQIWQFISSHGHASLYFGVAARRAGASAGALPDCQHLAALFVDIDFKVTAQEVAEAALDSFLPPSAILESGWGLHAYWLLIAPLVLPGAAERARRLLRQLAVKLCGDVPAGEPVRVLRIPWTLNHKYSPPRWVIIRSFNTELTYAVDGLERGLADVVDPGAAVVSADAGSAAGVQRNRDHYSVRLDFVGIAAGLADGERDVGLFKLACSLRARGYSRGAVEAAVLDAAARCRPPFPERLALQKVKSAWRYL
jgi:hypothetical protein